MELQLSLLRAVAVGLITLQCSIFSVVYGLPARGGTATERDGDDNGYEEYYYYEEDDVAADTGVHTVLLLSPLSGRLVVSTEDGLRNNGISRDDPLAQFVKTDVSYNIITLMNQDQDLLGIDSKGQLILDTRNSSDIFHEFEVVKENYEDDTGLTQLRVRISGTDCYIAFTDKGHPVNNACFTDKQSSGSFLSLVHL